MKYIVGVTMKHKLTKGTAIRVNIVDPQAGTVTGFYKAIIVSTIQIIVKPGGYATPCVTVLSDDGIYIVVNINNCSPDDNAISKDITDRYTVIELREFKHYYIAGKYLPENREYYQRAMDDGYINHAGMFIRGNGTKLEQLMSQVDISTNLSLD